MNSSYKFFLTAAIAISVMGCATTSTTTTTTPTPTPSPSSSPLTQKYDDLKFSIEVPEGYTSGQNGDTIYITKKPQTADDTPLPEMVIRANQTGTTSVSSVAGQTIKTSDDISINGAVGKKTTVSYPLADTTCTEPIYRLKNGNTITEFTLYECLSSPIFEQVVHSFRVLP